MAKIQKIALGQEAEAKDLINSIMQREFPDAGQSYPADDLDAIRENYCSVGEAFFVALSDDGRVIGTAAVKRDDERTALLRRIFVDPAHRKQRYLVGGLRHFRQEARGCALAHGAIFVASALSGSSARTRAAAAPASVHFSSATAPCAAANTTMNPNGTSR